MMSSSEEETEKLSAFLGRWKVTGQDFRAIEQRVEIEGEETYEWLPGAPVLVNNWSKNINDLIQKGTGLIGIECSHHAFSRDNDEYKVFTRSYTIRSDDQTWTFSGEKERVHIEFTEDGTQFVQKWESTKDGINWTAMWDIKGIKLKAV